MCLEHLPFQFQVFLHFRGHGHGLVPSPPTIFGGFLHWLPDPRAQEAQHPSHATSTWQGSRPRTADCARQQALYWMLVLGVHLGCSSFQMTQPREGRGLAAVPQHRSHMCTVVHIENFLL